MTTYKIVGAGLVSLLLTAVAQAQAPVTAAPVVPAPTLQAGATVFIKQDGLDVKAAKALQAKKAPLVLTTDRSQAAYELAVSSHDNRTTFYVTMRVTEIASGRQVFAYTSEKLADNMFSRGIDSGLEGCAKHLKDFIEKGKLNP